MAKFIAAYPKVSVEWLVTGKGTMLNDERPTSKKESVIIYQSDPKDAAIIADKQLIIERDAELITSLREKIKELEMRISNKSLGLPSAPAVDTPSVGGKRASHK